jgi:hypothetical protein
VVEPALVIVMGSLLDFKAQPGKHGDGLVLANPS